VADVPLTFTVSESTSWMGYSLDGQANVTVSGNTTLAGLSDGSHNIAVYASDTAGNMGRSGTFSFSIDTTTPTISITSPENQSYVTPNVPLIFTTDESVSWMGYCLDGQANVTIAGNTTLSELSEGAHSLIVYAKDMAENTGASEVIYFSIETPQPEPFPLWILGAVTVIVIAFVMLGVGATLVLRKRRVSQEKSEKMCI